MSNEKRRSSELTNKAEVSHLDNANNINNGDSFSKPKTLTQKIRNPFFGIPQDELWKNAINFAHEYGLQDYAEEIAKGSLVAQNPKQFEKLTQLTDEDKVPFRREITHKWSLTPQLYVLVFCLALGACVQGMDETVINGAQLFYPSTLGINPDEDVWIFGLINSAPYLCCAVLGCWLTSPLNRFFGRRGTIMITSFLSFATCIWSAVTNSWQHLLVSRLALGLGIGPKSCTVPVMASESSPPNIRGALVMCWQFFTAFGIMLGFVADLMFYKVPDVNPNISGLRWRLMYGNYIIYKISSLFDVIRLGSAGFPAIFVMMCVYMVPESPRWLMGRGKKSYPKAFRALQRLRPSTIQAGRDIYYIHVLMLEEQKLIEGKSGWNRFLELFTIKRLRRALLASNILSFGQQFCGINVIAYYSSNIFKRANFGEQNSLIASFGFGAVNTVFAIPGFFTIDHFGRRPLLLTSFPAMCIFLVITSLGFLAPADKQIIPVAIGVYLFTCFYSFGEGPVPFTYAAEAYPLSHRNLGMSFSIGVLWLFNFILSITFPALEAAMTTSGAFGWYAAWCAILFVLIFFFVPETKSLTLEELDQVFSVSTRKHAAYQIKQVPWFIQRYIFFRHVPKQPLYDFDEGSPELEEKIDNSSSV